MSTDDKTKQWYNQNAESYTEHVRDPKQSYYHAYYEKPAMYALLPDITGKRVFSLGCGSGEDSNKLKELGALESLGIDVSTELIAIAHKSYPDCEFQAMDMEHLDFADSSFDFAYSSLALHYIENWTQVFSEVYRVLKPNSYLLFSCGHPTKTAMEVIEDTEQTQVRQLAIIKDKPNKRVQVVGNYMDHRALDSRLNSLGDITIWHKPISEIITEARSAGFLVEQFVEPRPLEAMKEVSERDYIRLNKIPEFMIFRLLKV